MCARWSGRHGHHDHGPIAAPSSHQMGSPLTPGAEQPGTQPSLGPRGEHVRASVPPSTAHAQSTRAFNGFMMKPPASGENV
eukprot:1394424-Prymnesium_polylepis.2